MSSSGIRQLFGAETQIKALADAAQQVSEQLYIVSELRRQNSQFLNQLEKDWIDNLAGSATVVVERLVTLDEPVTERQLPRRSRLKNPVFLQQVKTIIQQSPSATTDLTRLLITAQSLNSAISLLSCCYDRYHWSQTGQVGVNVDVDLDKIENEDANEKCYDPSQRELSQFLHRRKQFPKERVARVVRLASLCMTGQRPVIVTNKRHQEKGIERSPSLFDKDTRRDSEPEGLLSLMIVESIEQWRENAELALRTATQRPSGGTTNEILDENRIGASRVTNPDVIEIHPTLAHTAQLLPRKEDVLPVPLMNSSLLEPETRVSVKQSKAESIHDGLQPRFSVSRKPLESTNSISIQASGPLSQHGSFEHSTTTYSPTNTTSLKLSDSVASTRSQPFSIAASTTPSLGDVKGPELSISHSNSYIKQADTSYQNTTPYYELPGSEVYHLQVKSVPQAQPQEPIQSHLTSIPSISSISQCSSISAARDNDELGILERNRSLSPEVVMLSPSSSLSTTNARRIPRGRVWLERQARMNS